MGDGLNRRELIGLGALVVAALPVARAFGQTPPSSDPDALLQAFADTIVPGRRVDVTESGAPIHPRAIAGVDREPGAVETDALALYHHPNVGFDALAPAFLADLASRAGGDFVALDFAARTEACRAGLAYDNPTRLLWEAAAAVPFTAFCAAALSEEQVAAKASGYRVMGLPGRSNGYRRSEYSYGPRALARERTTRGYLA